MFRFEISFPEEFVRTGALLRADSFVEITAFSAVVILSAPRPTFRESMSFNLMETFVGSI